MLYVSKMLGKEKSKFILIGKLSSLCVIVIGFIILGPIFGIVGLAIVMVCASLLQAVFLATIDKIQDGGKNVK